MATSLKSLRATSAGPFQLLTLIVLIVIGLGAFLAGTYLQVFDDGSGEPWTTDANSFSHSAIGHRAFVTTLRKLGIPVEVSRFRTLDRVGNGNLLLLIEPDAKAGEAILAELKDVPHALLVLPKWEGETDFNKPIWIDRMELLPARRVEAVLHAALPGADLVREKDKLDTDATRYGGKLIVNQPQYLNASDDIRTGSLLVARDGTLLAEHQANGNHLWILSDPDILSNAGLDDADNGVVAVAMIRSMLPRGGTVIIDETAHGFEQRPNLLRLLLHPPFIAVGLAGIAALLVLVWAGIARFGAPRPETVGLPAGKLTLVRNAAQLLRLGTTAANLTQSYRRMVLADAIAELHGPAGLDESAQAAWLDRAAAHRGLTIRVKPLLKEMASLAEADRLDAAHALRFSLDLHRWKQEILNGTVTTHRR
ncbi:MAG TPA: DUF4350 domain-containing protein [Dongiaceae bacterium]|nr:DUF4350 domain-containing protein [Dongiaceae bacterium]